ncbi:MAG TPA: 16S rRNA (adenine(1518)-N(6)/adenine(1519)-N(6))-dimethyltransferase RsmA [bacterium]|nr:16S rRNA (adenine(1518)-N(6)/adenine(1519)-N(6))-dimethyltransferase RsmA [bacterium]
MDKFLTKKKLRELLVSENLDIKKYLGQHFLVDRNARDKLLSFAEISKEDVIFEIGPGLGALTEYLIEKSKCVYGFEIDNHLCKILNKRFGHYKNFNLIETDFLQTDENFWRNFERVKVIGNTPYYLSSPIVFHILKFLKKISLSLLTVQKEVGEKFVAHPGNKNYGPISILLSLYTDSKICYSLKKDVFFPKPEVQSVAVKIIPLEQPKIEVEKKFWEFLPLIFNNRRKKLVNVINKIFKLSKEDIIKIINKIGISENSRVEELEPEKIYQLYQMVNIQATVFPEK